MTLQIDYAPGLLLDHGTGHPAGHDPIGAEPLPSAYTSLI